MTNIATFSFNTDKLNLIWVSTNVNSRENITFRKIYSDVPQNREDRTTTTSRLVAVSSD